MRYIDADRLVAEIEKSKNELKSLMSKLYYVANYKEWEAELNGYNKILSLIDSLKQEQPEYGYLNTTYIHGEKSRWNVGDTLAYYVCTSNEEGEIVIGKITNVEFDDEEGWIYTFEDEGASDEQSLIEQGVYKTN